MDSLVEITNQNYQLEKENLEMISEITNFFDDNIESLNNSKELF